MRCPKCVEQGKRSRVYPGESHTTCVYYPPGYYTEDGKWIPHLGHNTTTQTFRCSEGHEWQEAR